MTMELVHAYGRKPNADARSAPNHSATGRTRNGDAGPNGSGRMAYALARLRGEDEARSSALTLDARCYVPDPDEETQRPCGAAVTP